MGQSLLGKHKLPHRIDASLCSEVCSIWDKSCTWTLRLWGFFHSICWMSKGWLPLRSPQLMSYKLLFQNRHILDHSALWRRKAFVVVFFCQVGYSWVGLIAVQPLLRVSPSAHTFDGNHRAKEKRYASRLGSYLRRRLDGIGKQNNAFFIDVFILRQNFYKAYTVISRSFQGPSVLYALRAATPGLASWGVVIQSALRL